MTDSYRLDGKLALVTGGTKGIGLAVVEALRERGAEAVVVARSGGDVAADVATEAGRDAVVAAVEKLGRLDVLVNNVGTNLRKPTAEFDAADLHAMLDANLVSGFELTRRLLPILRESGGNVVNVSSVAAVRAVTTSTAAYAMTKAAVDQMTRFLAVEEGPNGVRGERGPAVVRPHAAGRAGAGGPGEAGADFGPHAAGPRRRAARRRAGRGLPRQPRRGVDHRRHAARRRRLPRARHVIGIPDGGLKPTLHCRPRVTLDRMTVAPQPPVPNDVDDELGGPPPQRFSLEQLVRGYFWTIFKNVVGWLCIVASPILGILLPGPGGIPLFIVGFALVTFPGKRRITTHVFRGRRLPVESPLFTGLITAFSVLVTAGVMWAVGHYYDALSARLPLRRWGLADVGKLLAIATVALPTTMLVSWVGLKLLNYVLLRWVPTVRRFVRRGLKGYGVRLLPTRRKRIGGGGVELVHDEIIGLDERQTRRLRGLWGRLGPWAGRVAGVSLTVAVLFFVIQPVVEQWPVVERRIGRLDVPRLGAGLTAFALGLLLFRAATWRGVLGGFGRHMPPAAAARAWSLGHLARYVPGNSYRVLRMELARPYGVSGPQANVAQRVEGLLAVWAALGVGGVAVLATAYARLPNWRPAWLALGALLAVAWLAAAVPGVFYKLAPADARRPAGRHHGPTRLRGGRLAGLLAWQAAGVAWQAGAVWLLVGQPLAADGVWLAVAGAWALGWAAGHLAAFAPGGAGVREVVFVACLALLLPPELPAQMREMFETPVLAPVGGGASPGVFAAYLPAYDLLSPASWQDAWWAFLFFLSLLLRLATTAAEVLFAAAATAFDWRAVVAFARGAVPNAW